VDKVRVGRVLKALGVFAVVMLIVALSVAGGPFPILGGATFQESMQLVWLVTQAALPQIAFQALIITVFAMNRIRSVPLILFAAALVTIFVSWASVSVFLWSPASNAFFRIDDLLQKLMSEQVAFALEMVVLTLVTFGGAFLLIKLIAAAEKRLAAPSVEAV